MLYIRCSDIWYSCKKLLWASRNKGNKWVTGMLHIMEYNIRKTNCLLTSDTHWQINYAYNRNWSDNQSWEAMLAALDPLHILLCEVGISTGHSILWKAWTRPGSGALKTLRCFDETTFSNISTSSNPHPWIERLNPPTLSKSRLKMETNP